MAPDIPDRWTDYKPIGERIEGTRFIAFKVPLREHISNTVDSEIRLDGNILLKMIPNLGIIIDLTNTNRYYSPNFFLSEGVEHKKLMIPGHVTPPKHLVNSFKSLVKEFIECNTDNDKLIGVHCTHGVNRTGYLICNYMISEMTIDPKEAINRFDSARGHKIERTNYLVSLNHLLENNDQNDSGKDTNDESSNTDVQSRRYDKNNIYNWRIEDRRSSENQTQSSRLRTDYYDQRVRPSSPGHHRSHYQRDHRVERYNDRFITNRSIESNDNSRNSEYNNYRPILRTDYYDSRPTSSKRRPRIQHVPRHPYHNASRHPHTENYNAPRHPHTENHNSPLDSQLQLRTENHNSPQDSQLQLRTENHNSLQDSQLRTENDNARQDSQLRTENHSEPQDSQLRTENHNAPQDSQL